ncbi:patatin-like phospholipase family protein [Oryzomicrobium sp.]|uniref:patatin-like phospholipase family protein n=1 Tax=Oryzomicrobium sp. TaxID=1911578 RepID=UPI002FE25AA3
MDACSDGERYYDSPALPAGHSYQTVALVLQGGGALGAYQAGVFEGLAAAGLQPNWVAGISIGALNAAIIAGNPPSRRVERLQEFWQTICRPPFFPPTPLGPLDVKDWPASLAELMNSWEAWRAVTEGQNGFFLPRPPFTGGRPPGPDTASYYDTAPLKATLESLVDFERINDPGAMRVSVGAVNVRTGNFVYFDNTRERLRPEHFMASGALPPGFPAVEIDGEFYWDGGVVSNTPLQYVLATPPRRHSLVFQVDLWSARGDLPADLPEVMLRQKDIQYSSRTRTITDAMAHMQRQRRLLRELMELVPETEHRNPWYRRAAEEACDRLFNVIHLIYRDKACEGHYKDYQFGALTMREHWKSGLADIGHTLDHPEWLEMPTPEQPFVTHDVHRAGLRHEEHGG